MALDRAADLNNAGRWEGSLQSAPGAFPCPVWEKLLRGVDVAMLSSCSQISYAVKGVSHVIPQDSSEDRERSLETTIDVVCGRPIHQHSPLNGHDEYTQHFSRLFAVAMALLAHMYRQ